MRFPPFNPYIAVVIGVIAVSTSAIFVKLASEAPASIIALYRLAFVALFLLPTVFIKYHKEIRSITSRDWFFACIASIFLALHFILWFESLNYTSIASSVVLIALQPIFVFIGTYFLFGERFSVAAMISIFITLIGSTIITWGDYQLNKMAFLGDILALLGAITITVSFLLGQRLRRSLSLISYTFIVYSISTVLLLLYNLIVTSNFVHYSLTHWISFIGLAIIPTFLGHFLFNWALKWLSTTKISIAIIFEPIGATLLAYLILEEIVTATQWLGGTIVIFGLLLFVVSTTRKNNVTISKRV